MRGRSRLGRRVPAPSLAILALAGTAACAAGPARSGSNPAPVRPGPARVLERPTEDDVLAPPTPVGRVGDLFGRSCETANPLCEQAATNLLQPEVALTLRPDGWPGLAAGFRVDGRRHWVFVPEARLDSLFRAAARPRGDAGPSP